MLNELLMMVAVVVGAFVGVSVWHNLKRPKNRVVTHVSLYIPAGFPPWALAMRWPEDDSPHPEHTAWLRGASYNLGTSSSSSRKDDATEGRDPISEQGPNCQIRVPC